jgi:hypothetical protein
VSRGSLEFLNNCIGLMNLSMQFCHSIETSSLSFPALPSFLPSFHTSVHSYKQTYVRTYIPYIHTYIHTYTHTLYFGYQRIDACTHARTHACAHSLTYPRRQSNGRARAHACRQITCVRATCLPAEKREFFRWVGASVSI